MEVRAAKIKFLGPAVPEVVDAARGQLFCSISGTGKRSTHNFIELQQFEQRRFM
jgi:hypothetical protein